MQQIERYGVIALLFLMVTLVTVGLWGDGANQPADTDEALAAEKQDAEVRPRERKARDQGLRAGDARGRSEEKAPLAFDSDEATRQAAARRAEERRIRELQREADKRRRVEEVPVQPVARRKDDIALDGFGYQEPRRDTTRRSASLDGDQPRRDERAGAGVPGPVVVKETPRKKKDEPRKPVGRSYTVKPGDSLARIAGRELGDQNRWPEIQELNGITNPNLVVEGMQLVLPEGAPQPKAKLATNEPQQKQAKNPKKSAPAAGTRTYIIKKGDVLSRIAQRECGSVKAVARILELNPKVQADLIKVGMKLTLPAADPRTAERSLVADAGRAGRNNRDSRYIVQ